MSMKINTIRLLLFVFSLLIVAASQAESVLPNADEMKRKVCDTLEATQRTCAGSCMVQLTCKDSFKSDMDGQIIKLPRPLWLSDGWSICLKDADCE